MKFIMIFCGRAFIVDEEKKTVKEIEYNELTNSEYKSLETKEVHQFLAWRHIEKGFLGFEFSLFKNLKNKLGLREPGYTTYIATEGENNE